MVVDTLINSIVVIGVSMSLLWLLSVALKNASIVDIFWGLGFVIVAWASAFNVGDVSSTGQVLLALTTLWGLRLSGYLWLRNHGKPEDFRYVAMRKHYGKNFTLISLVTVFFLQGLIMMVVSLPVQIGLADTDAVISINVLLGIVVFVIGIVFEAVGDWQLAAFKKNPNNAGLVMQTGLWKYTRHPNYFGDACVWWGIGIVAVNVSYGWIGLAGSLLMNFFLLRVSGVPMLEKSMSKRRPGYEEYKQRTSGFVQRRPKQI
jgi:steroid 5-alpha reductase family enzyme